jgi:hypothetical protein
MRNAKNYNGGDGQRTPSDGSNPAGAFLYNLAGTQFLLAQVDILTTK